MKKKNIFIACDSTNIQKIRSIIKNTQSSKLIVGYKFGLELFNSKGGRNFISKLRNKKIWLDLKLHDIPNTVFSSIKSQEAMRCYAMQKKHQKRLIKILK